jgi:4-aminobutyrate--pyruvate transaminase
MSDNTNPAAANSPHQKDVNNILHPYTNMAQHQKTGPMIIKKGVGARIYDENGKEYVEALAGLWCASLGFNEKRLVDAAKKQMDDLPYYHLFASKSFMPAIDLSEALLKIAPNNMDRVFFACSGSEANDTAIKTIYYYNNAKGRPNKKKIISRFRGYHGVTLAAASLTGLPTLHQDFDLPLRGILHTECPHYYRYHEEGESEEAFTDRMIESVEKLIEKEGADTIAAFFAEPVMGAGGVIMPPKGYFEKLQKLLKKNDILLVADEVICGFGRLGTMFGSESYNIKPDMVTVAKALSSAYQPISAMMMRKEIADIVCENSGKLGTFGHGYTYSGHPVATAVALETLRIYEEMDIVAHVQSYMPDFSDMIQSFADYDFIGDARAKGLIGAIEIVKDKKTRQYFDAGQGMAAKLASLAQENGLIVRAVFGDVVAFCPPLTLAKDDIGEMQSRMHKALNAMKDVINNA